MDSSAMPRHLMGLVKYYVILQICHITFLTRAGYIYLMDGRIPFPAQPPQMGWSADTIPFLFGMGAVDALAASLAIYAGWKLFKDSEVLPSVWMISLTIAMTSAVIYCFGILPSDAWRSNLIGYGIVALAFSPLLVLYVCFIRFSGKHYQQHD